MSGDGGDAGDGAAGERVRRRCPVEGVLVWNGMVSLVEGDCPPSVDPPPSTVATGRRSGSGRTPTSGARGAQPPGRPS